MIRLETMNYNDADINPLLNYRQQEKITKKRNPPIEQMRKNASSLYARRHGRELHPKAGSTD